MKRTCRICNETKDLETGFYRTIRHKSGFETRCRTCHAAISREYKRRTYNPEKARLISREQRKNGKARETTRRMALKYPEKEAARNKFHNAVVAGKILRKPCEICGSVKAEGHHEDYSKPLEVRWLCRKHHMEQHRKAIPPKLIEKICFCELMPHSRRKCGHCGHFAAHHRRKESCTKEKNRCDECKDKLNNCEVCGANLLWHVRFEHKIANQYFKKTLRRVESKCCGKVYVTDFEKLPSDLLQALSDNSTKE